MAVEIIDMIYTMNHQYQWMISDINDKTCCLTAVSPYRDI